ncbi:response regulator transcription factor [Sediminibacterium sp.]|uniref:response regulator transcription factor n=1 Tax=Sediminibacterium sp. TaxID=1917865 RepID=UPI003F6F6CF9
MRILIADHHVIFADGLATLLEKEATVEWINVESTHQPLKDLILTYQPHIILIDAYYPSITMSSLTHFLQQHSMNTKLIVLGSVKSDQLLLDLLKIGVTAFLLKTCTKKELLDSIISVNNGNTFYCSQTNKHLQQLIIEGRYHPRRKQQMAALSEKEKVVLKLISAEFTSKEIAAQLNMSFRTIEAYRKSLQEKTGSKNSAGLILYAIRNGIVTLEPSSLPSSISV